MTTPEHCVSWFFQEDSTLPASSNMTTPEHCVSWFFQEDSTLPASSNMTTPEHCVSWFFQEDSTLPASSNMTTPEHCVSWFFQEDSTLPASPNKTLSSNLDSSRESQNYSQSSLDDTKLHSLSQLTIQEQEPIKIHHITPRKMPLSPHYIIEEEFSTNPWALLVATIFLQRTTGKQARPQMKKFFEEYPTPYHVLEDAPTSLERFFDTLGLRKRGHTIWKMTYQFVSSKWRRASDLYGIGKYGEDAYRIFCLGHTDLDPDDRYLKLYLKWLRTTKFLEDNAVADCEYVIEDPAEETL